MNVKWFCCIQKPAGVLRMALVFGVAAALAGCPSVRERRGEKVQITDTQGNTFGLWVNIQGPGKQGGAATPTVVFENGLSDNTTVWRKVQPAIAQYTTTITYDRGGVGRSDAAPDPRTGDRLARELDALLTALEAPQPYILVAHSMGGLYARLYANMFPEKVGGLVLVDTDHEDLEIREALILSVPALTFTISLDVADADFIGGLGAKGEYYNRQTTFSLVRANRSIPPVPLYVLHAPQSDIIFPGQPEAPDQVAWDALKLELQQDLAALSPRSTIEGVVPSGHDIQINAPERVINAINTVFAAVTGGR